MKIDSIIVDGKTYVQVPCEENNNESGITSCKTCIFHGKDHCGDIPCAELNYKWQEQPESIIKLDSEINDILECIVLFDDTACLEDKGNYFNIIQRDIRKWYK